MDFSFSEEQTLLKDSVERFITNDYGFEDRQKYAAADNGFSADNWSQFAELGWLTVPFSEEDGGFGGSAVDLIVMMEEFGKANLVEPFTPTAVLCGNIGEPVLDSLRADADLYVVELSSFQLETTSSLAPLSATVLNVSEDHMDRYDDLADYQQTKQGIYRHADTCISNLDDALTAHAEDDVRFSLLDSNAEYSIIDKNGSMLAVHGEGWLYTSELKLKGRHNWANCLAAMALADSAGISRTAIVEALTSFTGLPHRSQWVAEIDGVNWINDSKATNPGAVKAAIEGIDETVILLAGGQGKGANMEMLHDTLKTHVRAAVLFGEDAGSMASAWQGSTSIEQFDTLEQAVRRAHEISQSGDIVLLSPACASFDQFTGFEQRGEVFCQLVEALQ